MFGGFFGTAAPATEFLILEVDGGVVGAVVVGAFRGEFAVFGSEAVMLRLGPFLELAFGVAGFFGVAGIKGVFKDVADGCAGLIDAAVEVDCSDDGFEGVFEHTVAVVGVVLALGFADAEGVGEPDVACEFCEGFTVDDLGAHTVEGAFVLFWFIAEEVFGDDEVEDGVAEEFEALVISRGGFEAGVREGLFQKIRVLE